MTDTLEHSPSVLSASPGDVLFSRQRIPYPGLILQGFTRQHRDLPKIEPFVSFQQLQLLLEFLEFVVLTERLIVPIPNFSRRTQKLVSSRRHWADFALFQATGDLALNTEDIVDKLTRAGVLFECGISVGAPQRMTSRLDYSQAANLSRINFQISYSTPRHRKFPTHLHTQQRALPTGREHLSMLLRRQEWRKYHMFWGIMKKVTCRDLRIRTYASRIQLAQSLGF